MSGGTLLSKRNQILQRIPMSSWDIPKRNRGNQSRCVLSVHRRNVSIPVYTGASLKHIITVDYVETGTAIHLACLIQEVTVSPGTIASLGRRLLPRSHSAMNADPAFLVSFESVCGKFPTLDWFFENVSSTCINGIELNLKLFDFNSI